MNDPYAEPLLKAMFYGSPGCGKTTLIGTAQDCDELWPMLYLNAKGNPTVLRNNERRPDVVSISQISDFNKPYDWIVEDEMNPETDFAKEWNLQTGYKCLVVDSTTEVQRHVVRRVAGGEYIGAGDLMPLLGRQGFGQLLGTMLNWADHFVELPMHVILISHEEDKEGHVKPLLWGQSGSEMCGQVLLVGRLVTQLAAPAYLLTEFQDEASFNMLQIMETNKVYAKEQYGINRTYIEAPTMSMIMGLINQGS